MHIFPNLVTYMYVCIFNCSFMKFVNCVFCTQSPYMCYFVAVTTLSPSSVLSTTSSQDTSAISNSIITTNASILLLLLL